MRRLLAICCATLPFFLIGCQTTPTDSPLGTGVGLGTDAATDREDQELAEIKDLLRQLGPNVTSDMRSLKDMLERQQEQLLAEAGPPDIVQDLWPTRRVLAEVIQVAQVKKADETLRGLDRLEPLIATVAAGLPARQIMTRSERALAYLSEGAHDRAYSELGVAYDIADKSPFARLVPAGVASLIQTSARSQISAGRTQEAASVIDNVRRTCAEHESLKKFERINSGLEGARDAVHREAWAVVEAELFEIHREITGLAESLSIDQWRLAPRQDDDQPEMPQATEEGAGEAEADSGESPEETPDAEVSDEAAEAPAEAAAPVRRPRR